MVQLKWSKRSSRSKYQVILWHAAVKGNTSDVTHLLSLMKPSFIRLSYLLEIVGRILLHSDQTVPYCIQYFCSAKLTEANQIHSGIYSPQLNHSMFKPQTIIKWCNRLIWENADSTYSNAFLKLWSKSSSKYVGAKPQSPSDTVGHNGTQLGFISPRACALCPTYLYISQKKWLRGPELLPDVECQR